MEDERRSKRRKCGLLALLLGGGGSVLLTAIAVTAGVTSSSSSSETNELNGTEQFTTEYASTVHDFTTTRAFPTTSKHTIMTTSQSSATSKNDIASPTTNKKEATADHYYHNTTPKDGSPGQEEETTTEDAVGQEAHTTAAGHHTTEDNGFGHDTTAAAGHHTTKNNGSGHDTTAVLLEEMTTSLAVVKCSHPDSIQNGNTVIQNGTEFGARVSYVCHEGYELQGGSPVIECLDNGEWRELNATCRLINCGAPLPMVDGYAVYSSTSYGSDARYYCNEGHRASNIRSNMTLHCGNGGIWEGDSTTCEIVSCGAPSKISNGFPVYNDTVYLSELRYKCHEGYLIENDYVRLCGVDGYWHGNQANCRGIECDILPGIDNGGVRVHGTSYMSESSYNCHSGHIMIGNSSRVCGKDETWSGSAPECINSTLFYCNYALVRNCRETHDGNWFTYEMIYSSPVAEAKGIQLISTNQPAELTTPAIAKYLGEACLSIEYYLYLGDADIIIYSDSMGSAGQKIKVLKKCDSYRNLRNFNKMLHLIAGDKVSIRVSGADGYLEGVNFYFHTINITAGQCNVDVNNKTSNLVGTMNSPNYPADYDNNLDLTEYINVPYGMKIKITFSDFETEGNLWCSADYLLIKDAVDDSDLLTKTCGSIIPDPLVTTGNSAYVCFKTDFSVVYRGWQLQWQAIDCGDCDCQ